MPALFSSLGRFLGRRAACSELRRDARRESSAAVADAARGGDARVRPGRERRRRAATDGHDAATSGPMRRTPTADQPKRFEEKIDVVAESPTEKDAPAELPVRPAEVMAVAGAADNVFRALQTLPGVAATTEFDSRLSVRGGSPDENLTIMDGVEIHNPYRLFGLTSAFNPETVRSFDLVRRRLLARSTATGSRRSSSSRTGRATTPAGFARLERARASPTRTWSRRAGCPAGARLVARHRRGAPTTTSSRTGSSAPTCPSFGDLQARADWQLGAGRTPDASSGLLSRESDRRDLRGRPRGRAGSFVTNARNDLGALTFRRRSGARRVADDRVLLRNTRRPRRRRAVPERRAPVERARRRRRLRDGRHRLHPPARRSATSRCGRSGGLGRPPPRRDGFEAHGLRTGTSWRIVGDRNPNAANGSSVQGGAGLPRDLDSRVDSARAGAWVQDRWDARRALSVEAGLRLDWSGVNRRGDAVAAPRRSRTGSTARRACARAAASSRRAPATRSCIQSDYFVDLSGRLGRSLRYERAWHAVLGLERDLGGGDDGPRRGLLEGLRGPRGGPARDRGGARARVARYDFPAELASSIPTEALITSVPENGGAGAVVGRRRALPEARRRRARSSPAGPPTPTRRRARDEYGLSLPFEYDRPHAATLVGSWRFGPKWELAATLRAYSGFPRTPVAGAARGRGRDRGRPLRAGARRRGPLRLRDEPRRRLEPELGAAAGVRPPRPAPFVEAARGGGPLAPLPRRDQRHEPEERRARSTSTLEYDPGSSSTSRGSSRSRGAAIPFLPSFGVRFRF